MANFNVVVDGTQYSDTDIRIMRERIVELEEALERQDASAENERLQHDFKPEYGPLDALKDARALIQYAETFPHQFSLKEQMKLQLAANYLKQLIVEQSSNVLD